MHNDLCSDPRAELLIDGDGDALALRRWLKRTNWSTFLGWTRLCSESPPQEHAP